MEGGEIIMENTQGNNIIEHKETCNHCIMIAELKERTIARVVKDLNEYVIEKQEECFNERRGYNHGKRNERTKVCIL